MNKRLLRSLLSLMVCMAMLLSLTPAALAESADAPSTEMAVGAVIHGFEVVENGEFALLNAKTTVLRHQKTGATVFFLINEDTNRAFDISFVTPLSDDKGIPHVFEHSTLDGSKKYPSGKPVLQPHLPDLQHLHERRNVSCHDELTPLRPCRKRSCSSMRIFTLTAASTP